MANSIQDYLISTNDPYRPNLSKPSLQQWDNYQIYDLFTRDIEYLPLNPPLRSPIAAPSNKNMICFVAAQRFNPTPIPVDFRKIASDYR
jgi:hypothetical protein